MPDISIVIPTYNGSRFIGETIDSIKHQTFADWEVIVVDDGSTDNTLQVVRRYVAGDARIHLIEQPNGGESTARNTGYAHVKSDSTFIIFFDHDDLWEPDTLASLLEVLICHPNVIGAYGIGQFVDSEGQPIMKGELEAWCRLRKKRVGKQWVDCGPSDPTTLESLAAHNSIPTPGVCLLRRSLLPPNPLFPPQMRAGSGDVHFFLRLARKANFVFLNKSLIRGRRHSNNITNNGRRNDRTLIQAYQDVIALPDTTDEQRRLLMEGYSWRCYAKAHRHLDKAGQLLLSGRFVPATMEVVRAARSYGYGITGLPIATEQR